MSAIKLLVESSVGLTIWNFCSWSRLRQEGGSSLSRPYSENKLKIPTKWVEEHIAAWSCLVLWVHAQESYPIHP